MTDAQRTVIEQIVRQQGEEYLASLAALDADRTIAHFAKDDFNYVGHGAGGTFVYPSYEAALDHVREVISGLREAQLGWNQIRVYVLSQDAAVFHGPIRIHQARQAHRHEGDHPGISQGAGQGRMARLTPGIYLFGALCKNNCSVSQGPC